MYRLALAMGRADVGRLAAELDPEQVDWWEAFDAVEPLGREGLYDVLALIGVAVTDARCGAEAFTPWRVRPVDNGDSGAAALAAVRAGVLALAGRG